MLNSPTLDNNKPIIITNQIFKPFDTYLALIMTNLANGKVSLKLNSSVLAQKTSSSLYSNFILNLYIVHEVNNWSINLSNNFTLKNCLFGTAFHGAGK